MQGVFAPDNTGVIGFFVSVSDLAAVLVWQYLTAFTDTVPPVKLF